MDEEIYLSETQNSAWIIPNLIDFALVFMALAVIFAVIKTAYDYADQWLWKRRLAKQREHG